MAEFWTDFVKKLPEYKWEALEFDPDNPRHFLILLDSYRGLLENY